MKQLTVAQAIDQHKLVSDQPWLLAVKVVIKDAAGATVDTLYMVRNDEDIDVGGQNYTAVPFEVSASESTGELPTFSMTFQDQLGVIQNYMNQHNGIVGSNVEILVITPDNLASANPSPDLVESYDVVGASANDWVVTFELGAENPLTLIVPRRVQYIDRCSFKYKGDECGYVGAIVNCDLSLHGTNGCVAHSNQANFGGYPGLSVRAV